MRWFFNNFSYILPVLLVVGTALNGLLRTIMAKHREAEAKRLAGGDGGMPGPSRTIVAAPQSARPQPMTIQDELAAQRRAQIEMWRAREAMLRGETAESSTPVILTAEDEMAQRRRLAMEELRRRQAAMARTEAARPVAQTARQPQTAPAPRPRPERDTARRRQAPARPAAPAPTIDLAPSTRAAEQGGVPASARSATTPTSPAIRAALPAARHAAVGSLILSPQSLRQAVILKELLDPPLAIRDNPNATGGGYHQSF